MQGLPARNLHYELPHTNHLCNLSKDRTTPLLNYLQYIITCTHKSDKHKQASVCKDYQCKHRGATPQALKAKMRENCIFAAKSTEKDKKRKDLPLKMVILAYIILIYNKLYPKMLCFFFRSAGKLGIKVESRS